MLLKSCPILEKGRVGLQVFCCEMQFHSHGCFQGQPFTTNFGCTVTCGFHPENLSAVSLLKQHFRDVTKSGKKRKVYLCQEMD